MATSAGVCRICLSVGATLSNIADTPLQSIYENLTTLTLHTADGRPLEACCICRAQLNKSRKLMLKALKAEAILSAILDRSAQVTKLSVSMIDRQALGLCGELTSSSAECFDNILPARVEIKTEALVEGADNTEMEYGQLEEPPQPQPAAAINILLKEECDADGDKFFIDIRPITVARDAEINTTVEEDIVNDGEPEKPSGAADEKPFQCYICLQQFENENDLKFHRRIHRGKKPECSICKQTFTRPESLKRHLRTHTGEKPYECNICQRRFSSKNNLVVHRIRHTGEKFTCNVCNRKYSEKRTLKLHLIKHIAEKPHQCSICLHLFEQSSQLESHMKTHNAVTVRERSISHQRCEQNHRPKTQLRTHSEKYECHICKKTLTRKTSLKTHLRTHTGEKPYECTVCKRRFADKNNLVVHARCHTLDKPFQCYICNHKFYQKSNLNTHLRTHTGDAPYECNVCHRKFNQSSNLHSHFAKCHSGVGHQLSMPSTTAVDAAVTTDVVAIID